MEAFNREQIKRLRETPFARMTLIVVGLAVVTATILSAVWGQGNTTGVSSEAPHTTATISASEGNATGVPTQAPHLTEITPARGPAGSNLLQATLRGTGFMRTDNLIEFGPARLAGVPSASESEITVVIPKSLPSTGEVPPMALQPGEYQVKVTTSAGTSNALTFTLTQGP